MTEDRLERLEKIVESNSTSIQALSASIQAFSESVQALSDGLTKTRQITESNAKSIQAISDSVASDRERWRKERQEGRQDRRRVFEWMARLAAAQADFYEMQTDHLNHLDQIDDRLTSILERLTPKDEAAG